MIDKLTKEGLNDILELIVEDLELALDAYYQESDMEKVREQIEMALHGLGTMDRLINFHN